MIIFPLLNLEFRPSFNLESSSVYCSRTEKYPFVLKPTHIICKITRMQSPFDTKDFCILQRRWWSWKQDLWLSFKGWLYKSYNGWWPRNISSIKLVLQSRVLIDRLYKDKKINCKLQFAKIGYIPRLERTFMK